MRTSATLFSAAVLTGLAAASPAPQQLDFDQLAAAPAVQTAPILNGVSNQTVTISSAAIAQSISAAITAQATAAASAPAQAVNKRDLEKRTFGYNWWNCMFWGVQCGDDSPATTSSSTVKTTSTSSKASSTSAVATTSSKASSSSSSSSKLVSSSSTASGTTNPSSGTSTSSSTTACPTTPEDGTYCGFINPEDPCAPQPDGYGPKVTPDTADAFSSYAPFHSMATAAPTSVPAKNVAGNAYQQTFKDLFGSSSANSYLGLYTLTSYSPADCAAHCDTTNLCTAFNIYIERDPSQNPSTNASTDPTVWGRDCPKPSSITNFKCTLWGSNLESATATNQGGWRQDFQVVVVASNGYDATNVTVPPVVVDNAGNTTSTVSAVLSTATAVSSTSSAKATSSAVAPPPGPPAPPAPPAPVTPPTWSPPKTCGGKAIQNPSYWMGSKFFPGPFNPQVCADFASYQHVLNKRSAISAGKSYFTPCNSFNAYYLHKNGIPHGTYCALYDASISTSYATYTGGVSGGNKYDCRQSYQYTRQTLDQGRC